MLRRLLHKLAFVLPGGTTVRPWLHRLRGVRMGRHVWIGQLVYIDELHPEDVTIGDNSTIGLRTSIFSHFYWGPRRPTGPGKVVIGKDVFIGPHCVILPNVRIGEGAVIRAGSVVSRNVPPHVLWGCQAGEPLGIATVPLTKEHSYQEFTRGVRPVAGRAAAPTVPVGKASSRTEGRSAGACGTRSSGAQVLASRKSG